MILGTGPQMISNAEKPQLLDMVKGIGYGLVFAAVGLTTSTAKGAEYHWGTHQTAIYESQFKGIIFHPPRPNIPGDAVRAFVAAPQSYIFTLPAQISQACIEINQSVAIPAEYQSGTHATQLANSQIQPRVWAALNRPFTSNDLVPLRSFHVNPQELYKDLTLQGSFPFVPVATGWILTYVGAGPQLIDLTLQAGTLPALHDPADSGALVADHRDLGDAGRPLATTGAGLQTLGGAGQTAETALHQRLSGSVGPHTEPGAHHTASARATLACGATGHHPHG